MKKKRETERMRQKKEVRRIDALYYLTVDRVKGCWVVCWISFFPC